MGHTAETQPLMACKDSTVVEIETEVCESNTVDERRCWCCWETTSIPTNPLIRVCLGCRDPDLQLIHQHCVDRWLTELPAKEAGKAGEEALWKCSRCGDVYEVQETLIHPLRVILEDIYLSKALILLILGSAMVTGSCMLVVIRHWNSQEISTARIAFGFILCSNLLTFRAARRIIRFASGRLTRHAIGIQMSI